MAINIIPSLTYILPEEGALEGIEGTELALFQTHSSHIHVCHCSLQGIHSPVVVVPAQEPSGEGGRLEALFDDGHWGPLVPRGWVCVNVALGWGHREGISLSTRPAEQQLNWA